MLLFLLWNDYPWQCALSLPTPTRVFDQPAVCSAPQRAMHPDRFQFLVGFACASNPSLISTNTLPTNITFFLRQPHKFATYGIVPSTAASSDDESEDTLPRASLNAPIEALQGSLSRWHVVPSVAVNHHPFYFVLITCSFCSLAISGLLRCDTVDAY